MLYLFLIGNLVILIGTAYFVRHVRASTSRLLPLLVSIGGLVSLLFLPVVDSGLYNGSLSATPVNGIEDMFVVALRTVFLIGGVYYFLWGIVRAFKRQSSTMGTQ
jgi:hypothetical protein